LACSAKLITFGKEEQHIRRPEKLNRGSSLKTNRQEENSEGRRGGVEKDIVKAREKHWKYSEK